MRKYFALIILFLLLPLANAWGAGTPTSNGWLFKPPAGTAYDARFGTSFDAVDTRLAKEFWIGDPGYGATLQDAITAIGSTPAILRVPIGSHSGSGLIIPATLTLKPERGALFTGNGTMTINGPFLCGPWQCFGFTGGGKAVFGNPLTLYPEWWGAVADGGTNDHTSLQACLTAAAAGSTVQLQGKAYYDSYTATPLYREVLDWPLKSGITLQGVGRGITQIIFDRPGTDPTNATGLYLWPTDNNTATINGLTIRDLTLQGRDDGVNRPHGLVGIGNSYTGNTISNIVFKNVEFTKAGCQSIYQNKYMPFTGWRLENCWFHDLGNTTGEIFDSSICMAGAGSYLQILNSRVENCFGTSTTHHFLYSMWVSDVLIQGNYFSGSSRLQFRNGSVEEEKGLKVVNNTFNNVPHTLWVQDISDAVIANNIFEDSGDLSIGYANDANAVPTVTWPNDISITDNLFKGQNTVPTTGTITLQGFAKHITIANNSLNLNNSYPTPGLVIGRFSNDAIDDVKLFANKALSAAGGAGCLLYLNVGTNISAVGNYLESTVAGYVVKIAATFGANLYLKDNTATGTTHSLISYLPDQTTYKGIVDNKFFPAAENITSFPYKSSTALVSGTKAVAFPGGALGGATYGVTVTGDAAENYYVTSKTVTGFTLNSSNGSSTSNVDFSVFEPLSAAVATYYGNPVYGSNVLLNGDMETGSPPSSWTTSNSGTFAADIINFESGIQSIKVTMDGSGTYGGVQQTATTVVGTWYKSSAGFYGQDLASQYFGLYVSGTPNHERFFPYSNGFWVNPTGTYPAVSTSTTVKLIVDGTSVLNAGKIFNVDNAALLPITFSSMFPHWQSATINETATADLTAPDYLAPLGVACNWDSSTNPQSGVIVYLMNNDHSSPTVCMDKYVAGVRTAVLAPTNVSYVAGRTLSVQAALAGGTITYTILYGGSAVGTPQTVSDAAIIGNILWGVFNGSVSNYATFSITP